MEACDEETPLLFEKKENCHKKITYKEAMIHMMKANVGTGILAMPNAIKNSGLQVGSLGLMVMAVTCTHCMHLLLDAAEIQRKKFHRPFLTYSDTLSSPCD